MGELIPAAKDGGFAENDELAPHGIGLVDILSPPEPHQVYHPVSIGKVGHHALSPGTHTVLVETQDLTLYLHKGHVGRHLAYQVDAAAVYVLVGEVLQQSTPRRYVQLVAQYISLLGPHARQVHDVLVQDV